MARRTGSCALNYEKRAGKFYCAGCDSLLFAAATKFESGTGWPSFNDPVAGAVETTIDRSHGMTRTEVIARAAAPTSAISLTTGRRRRICAIASMASR